MLGVGPDVVPVLMDVCIDFLLGCGEKGHFVLVWCVVWRHAGRSLRCRVRSIAAWYAAMCWNPSEIDLRALYCNVIPDLENLN